MSVRPGQYGAIKQDMPPPGGYRKVDTLRVFPKRGPSGLAIWSTSAVVIAYGFYQVGQMNQERNQQKYLERKARYEVAPVLQAEADREYLERELKILQKEKEIMKAGGHDMNKWGEGTGQSFYSTGKFMPRAINGFDTTMK